MADHSTTPEQVVKKANEEVKTIEHENVSPSKESGEEEKPKAEELPSPAAPLAESEEKFEVKQVEPLIVEEVKKNEEMPAVAPGSIPELDICSVSEPAIELVEKLPEEQPKIFDIPKSSVEAVCGKEEQVEVLPVKESEIVIVKEVESSEVVSKKEEIAELEEQAKIVDVSESSAEATEKKKEQVEVIPMKESEVVVVKEVESSEAESKKELTPEPVPEVEDKPQEVVDLVEKDCAEVKPKESVEVEIVKDAATLTDKVEAEKLEEKQITKEEPLVIESSDQVISTIEEAQVGIKDKVDCLPADVAEKFDVEDKEKELIAANVVEGLSKEDVVELEKTEVEKELANDVKTEEVIGEKRITEELNQPETNKIEGVSSSISTIEVIEKYLEGQNTKRDIDLVAENGKKCTKDETLASSETRKDQEAEEKADEVTTATVKEQAEEPLESQREGQGEETVEIGETNLVKEKEDGEIAKPDVPNPESTKDGDEMKTSQDPVKEEVAAKPTQKQSNNIIAKVKQSLVKAKKAIIGKSSNSKSVSSETKSEVKD